ncbi:signal recognition particle protein [Segniliparus rotundus DSM 44985]|uniref:Signal recognition particle protein n=1 Tax=Segniliparus rotundus (strain ATCC BAA-972 / CDC 1076 / CIP 108378 / DSM 44985 / JCM 13578) TaxID=640132 RepID=D6Z8Z9_SEGRD|nr:signal recognition particle protein [Segniliparus rotundus]ADG98429.1 signal recognition particle protein [Segniliparus rotundus DSM 44985]
MFSSLSDRLVGALSQLRGKGKLSEEDIDVTCKHIRIALLEADVALPVVREFVARVKERAKGVALSGALNPAQQVVKIVDEELTEILGGESRRLWLAKTPPTVIMLVGLQGAGKTTLAGKLAKWLKSQGHAPLLVACDLQRPGAVKQLQVVAERAGVAVHAPQPGASLEHDGVTAGDPVAVARSGVQLAREQHHDVVVVDTAGRLGVDQELMAQAAAIRDAVSPDEVLFTVDAMIGQDALHAATAFDQGVGFTGVVLTKLDGDARGGAALSVRQVTGKPILFASSGEKLEDFDVFHPDRMSSRILDMGDLLSLIEQAQRVFDEREAEEAAQKMASGEMTLQDFLQQLKQMRQLGPLANVLGMLPGAGQMKDALANVDERDLDRLEAIICGMTPGERADPKIINASRRMRIANGSGVTVNQVNQLVDQFFQMKKVMGQLAGGMFGGGFGSRPSKAKAKAAKKGKGKKGRGPQRQPAGGLPGAPGLPQGLYDLPPGLEDVDLSSLQLPPMPNFPGFPGR